MNKEENEKRTENLGERNKRRRNGKEKYGKGEKKRGNSGQDGVRKRRERERERERKRERGQPIEADEVFFTMTKKRYQRNMF